MKEVTREDWLNNPTPRMMWVWDGVEGNKEKRFVCYILTDEESKQFDTYPVITPKCNYHHCAEIEEPKRMTNYELAKWLYEGAKYGEFREYKETNYAGVFSYRSYREEYKDLPCQDNILIRVNGGEWREPLVEVEE